MSDIAFPWHADARGRSAVAGPEEHVADLVEAVLFTAPGERVNRPSFGCGLERLLFAPIDPTIVGAMELTVRGELERWLAGVVEVQDVEVNADGSKVQVTVQYSIVRTGNTVTTLFERGA